MTTPPPLATTDDQRPMRGIVLMLISIGVYALQDAIAKHLAPDYSPIQILFFRALGAILILLPLLRPHLVSAWMILFVLFILELNITILLYRSSSRTMSVYIWSQLDTLSQSAAYPVSLLQCLIVAVVLFVVARFKMSIRVRAAQ